MTGWAVPPCDRDKWMVSALGMPERAVHLVRAGTPYRWSGISGYYLAACGYQCMQATADYLRDLPVCPKCERRAGKRGKLKLPGAARPDKEGTRA